MHGPATQDTSAASQSYVAALRSLRISLDDPALAPTPETLAAACLLQMYEQYTDHLGQHWIFHARGVVKMLQARGASNLQDDIEKAILEVQAANRESFLAHSAWKGVLKPSAASESNLDAFTRMVVDGVRFPSIDTLCASLVQQCDYDYLTPARHRVMVDTAAVGDMLRVREQLQAELDIGEGLHYQLGTRDPIRVAAYAATGFFAMTTNTILLGLLEQLTRMAPERAPRLRDGLTAEVLKAERLSALERVTARFRLLATLDPEVRFTAPTALRVILGTILGIGGPTSTEAATLLVVLDQGLVDAPWTYHKKCGP
ncbi:hypothetical protein B0A55_04651 [Friedmanniomyces simplex]|uniref:Uncharacterized protein n=1 Tax=Friedmanniomyces simplex TaxID=329884 RepID=A0A4U0XL47_9PEZI|nr:hypothetical protein B0A55_04651 [Friedmanniomyces simplex]